MPVLFGQAAFDDRADSLHQGVAGDKIFWLNWLMENDRDLARPDRVTAFRHDVVRADYRHRHYRDPALHCQVERAFFEGQEFAVERALPFHIDGHGHSVFHNSFGPANGFDEANSLALGPNGIVAVTGSSSGDYATIVYREPLSPVAVRFVPAGVRVRFTGAAGYTYQVQRASELSGPWSTLTVLGAAVDGATLPSTLIDVRTLGTLR